MNQKEAAFPDAQAKIDAGWKEVKAQEKKLEPARKEIQEKEAQLEMCIRDRYEYRISYRNRCNRYRYGRY